MKTDIAQQKGNTKGNDFKLKGSVPEQYPKVLCI